MSTEWMKRLKGKILTVFDDDGERFTAQLDYVDDVSMLLQPVDGKGIRLPEQPAIYIQRNHIARAFVMELEFYARKYREAEATVEEMINEKKTQDGLPQIAIARVVQGEGGETMRVVTPDWLPEVLAQTDADEETKS